MEIEHHITNFKWYTFSMSKKPNQYPNNKKIIWSAIILLILFVVFTAPIFRNEVNKNVVAHTSTLRDDAEVVLPRGTLLVQLANTPTTRELGLSYRESIGDEEGMLFIFDKPDIYAFWMKDMKFAIDMVWLSENGQVVHIQENATPESYPTVFSNKPKAQYVLELNAGNAAKYGLYLGVKVDLSTLAK